MKWHTGQESERKNAIYWLLCAQNTWFEIWNEIINAQRIYLSNKAIKRGQEIGIVQTNERGQRQKWAVEMKSSSG